MGLLDGWFPTTMFGATGSPDAMESDKSVSDLLMRLQLAQAGPSANDGVSLPFAGIMPAETVAPTPAAAQKKPQFAPSIEPSTLESGSTPMEGPPTTKVGSRLPSETLTAMEAGRTTTIPKSPAVRSGNMTTPSAPDFSPSLGERISNFGDALTGRAYTNFNDQGRTRKATYDALIGMGLDPKMAEAAVRQPELLKAIVASKLGTKGRTQYGLKPEWGERTLPDGSKEWVMMQAGDDATVAESKLPPGVSPLPPGEIASQRAFGSTRGKETAEAFGAMPKVTKDAAYLIEHIDKLSTAEGLDSVVGSWQGRMPEWTNLTDGATDAQARIDQILGETFLAAFNSLRGGGQITEAEGRKATDALNRLGKQQQGEAAYRQAMKDFREGVVDMLQIARTRAGLPQLPEAAFKDKDTVLRTATDAPGITPAQPQRGRGGFAPGRGGIPAHARQGRDGNWYTQEPDGRYKQWP